MSTRVETRGPRNFENHSVDDPYFPLQLPFLAAMFTQAALLDSNALTCP